MFDLTICFSYVLTVLAGLILHTVITCPILYFLITRKNPMFIVRGMMQAIVTAFGTASGYVITVDTPFSPRQPRLIPVVPLFRCQCNAWRTTVTWTGG